MTETRLSNFSSTMALRPSMAELHYNPGMGSATHPVVTSDEQALLDQFGESQNLDDLIPRLARDRDVMQRIDCIVRAEKTTHELIHGDARAASELPEDSMSCRMQPK